MSFLRILTLIHLLWLFLSLILHPLSNFLPIFQSELVLNFRLLYLLVFNLRHEVLVLRSHHVSIVNFSNLLTHLVVTDLLLKELLRLGIVIQHLVLEIVALELDLVLVALNLVLNDFGYGHVHQAPLIPEVLYLALSLHVHILSEDLKVLYFSLTKLLDQLQLGLLVRVV